MELHRNMAEEIKTIYAVIIRYLGALSVMFSVVLIMSRHLQKVLIAAGVHGHGIVQFSLPSQLLSSPAEAAVLPRFLQLRPAPVCASPQVWGPVIVKASACGLR